jgi:hypothetical protein
MSKNVTTVSAKENSKQMHDLVKDNQQIERAWYGVQGNEWTRTMGVEVTHVVQDLLAKKKQHQFVRYEFRRPSTRQEENVGYRKQQQEITAS